MRNSLGINFIALLSFVTADPQCRSTARCQCDSIYAYNKNYTCLALDTRVEILVGSLDIKITCEGFEKSDAAYLDFLDGIAVKQSINVFILHKCPLPDKPFVEVFKSLKLANIHNIVLRFVPEFIDISKMRQLNNLADDLLSLFVKHNNVELSENAFRSAPNLERLTLSNNSIYTLPATIFYNLRNLTHLGLDNNKLTNLPAGLFSKSTSLIDVCLDHNRITSLPEELFENCDKMAYFSCQGNRLRSLPAKIFEKPKYIKELDLGYNQLEYLDDSVFGSLEYLEILILSGNRLKFLSSDIFANLSWLKALHINENRLMYFQQNTFQNLRNLGMLDLSDNQLMMNQNARNFAPFSSCKYLRQLNLRNNSLRRIFFDMGFAVNQLQLDLSFNKLTSLEAEELFPKVSQGQSMMIDLSNNEITTIATEKLNDYSKNWCHDSDCSRSLIMFNLTNNPINIPPLIEYMKRIRFYDASNTKKPNLCFDYHCWKE